MTRSASTFVYTSRDTHSFSDVYTVYTFRLEPFESPSGGFTAPEAVGQF